jgi:mono/diheme cytochrome c family protein
MSRRVRTALASLALAACGDRKTEPPRAFEPGPVPADLALGEESFNQNCAGCHGSRALGSELGPPLVHIIYEPNHHSDESFRRAVALGVVPHHWSFGPMPAQPELSSGQIEEIIRYVRWLQARAGIT